MEEIIRSLYSFEEVLFVFLFGSVARGSTSKLSDIDIGVYLDPSLSREEMFDVLVDISSRLRPNVKGDLVLLNTAPPGLAFEIIKGKPLVVRDECAMKEFVYETLKIYHDRRYYDLRWAKAVLSR